MAEELSQFADILETADDFDAALQKLVCDTFTAHSRILFSGNGYSEEWRQEAARRGLSDLRTTVDAMPSYVNDKNVELVTKHGIFTEAEFRARNAIHLEAYSKIINIEAKTTADMAIRQIIPAVSRYCAEVASNLYRKESVGCSVTAEKDLVKKLSEHTDTLYALCEKLKSDLANAPHTAMNAARYFCETIVPDMDAVRKEADILELLTDKSYWPFPTYSDLLFY